MNAPNIEDDFLSLEDMLGVSVRLLSSYHREALELRDAARSARATTLDGAWRLEMQRDAIEAFLDRIERAIVLKAVA